MVHNCVRHGYIGHMTKYDNSDPQSWAFETRAIHAGQQLDSDFKAVGTERV